MEYLTPPTYNGNNPCCRFLCGDLHLIKMENYLRLMLQKIGTESAEQQDILIDLSLVINGTVSIICI